MEKKIKVIIVDDEKEARDGLKFLLEKDPDLRLVATCKNGIEAIEALTNFKIDLMFLDIQMPMVDGFEVIRSISEDRTPSIIFTTAYDQYAVKAFEIHAIDYLLKPFTDQRFFEALSHAKEFLERKELELKRNKLREIAKHIQSGKESSDSILINPASTSDSSMERLIVKEGGQVHFIPLSGITWIEAYDYYVKVHIEDRFFLLRESMKKLIESLPGNSFVRIHKSSIINIPYIKSVELIGNGEYQVHLTSGEQLKVSRSFKDSIRHLI